MNQKPIIGVTSRKIKRAEWDTPLIGHHESYLDAIVAAGGIPLIIPLTTNQADIKSIYERLDGILFAGGEDVDPKLYQEAPHKNLGKLSAERDVIETALARLAFEDKKPSLAICRGIQVVNVALGGSLYQDIDSQLSSDVQHRGSDSNTETFEDQHPITLEADSHLAALLGKTEACVNTSHHQSINRLAPQLRIVAKAPDGVIEAVEGPSDRFFIGVQCHPELLWSDTQSGWGNVFKAFVTAAAHTAQTKK